MKNQLTLSEIKKYLSSKKSFLKKKYHVSEIGIFGSFAKNSQKPTSDLDILVEFSKTPSLFQLIELEQELSEELGIKVDLVMKRSIRPELRDTILNEVVIV